MPHFELTDRQGRRYRLQTEIHCSPHWVEPLDYLRAEQWLQEIDVGQLFMAEQHLFGVGGDFPYLRQPELEQSGYLSAQAPFALTVSHRGSLQVLLEAIRHGELTLRPREALALEDDSRDRRSELRVNIRLALAEIIAQEGAQAAQHRAKLAHETPVSRSLIYSGSFLHGLWSAGSDVARWVKEVNDVANPTQRILRALRSSIQAGQQSAHRGESYRNVFVAKQLTAEKRQLVEALGFDPSAITPELFRQALEAADIIWADSALRGSIGRFAVDYVRARHPIELVEVSGAAAFEVLFTVLLAAVTAGAGAIRQGRELARFRGAGDLLLRFAQNAADLAKRKARGAPGKSDAQRDFRALPRDEVAIKPPAKPEQNRPRRSKNSSKPATADRRETPKRPRPAPDNWETYQTHGLEQAPMASEIGREMVATLESQGLSRARAVMKAQEFLNSGADMPVRKTIKQGEKLYKLVPAGEAPGKHSAYFAEISDIDNFEGLGYDEISDAIGIPLESQQTLKFDLVEVEAQQDVTVYQSTIAATSQNGYAQPGGARQTLIIDRSKFSDPKFTGRKLP